MRISQNLALMAALSMAGLGALSAQPMEPAAEPEPGSARNKPSGNTPVSGGGARERERRLRQMSKQQS